MSDQKGRCVLSCRVPSSEVMIDRVILTGKLKGPGD